MKTLTLILLLCLYGCADNKPHQEAPYRQSGGTQQNSNGVISAPIGKIETGLTNNETTKTATRDINEFTPEVAKTIIFIVLAFALIIIAGFIAAVLILIHGHRTERQLWTKSITSESSHSKES